MKIIFAFLATTLFSTSALAENTSVSVRIGQPGFYGRIDISNGPTPEVIYHKPREVRRAPAGRPPIYLRVPPGQAKHWSRHCREYKACGERVYFVQDNWYLNEYVPRYQEQHRNDQDNQHHSRRHKSGRN